MVMLLIGSSMLCSDSTKNIRPDLKRHRPLIIVRKTYKHIVECAIQSFNPGSTAGPDKLRPQHLKETCTKQTGEGRSQLIAALTSLANSMLAGKINKPTYIYN